MMNDSLSNQNTVHGSFRSYALGFIFSLVLTFLAYFIVVKDLVCEQYLTASLITLGVIQAAIQVKFFLHVEKEPKPRWNLQAFLFMTMVVVLLVGGTLWIMDNLKYNVMLQEGIQKS